jgi:hypothetical protein
MQQAAAAYLGAACVRPTVRFRARHGVKIPPAPPAAGHTPCGRTRRTASRAVAAPQRRGIASRIARRRIESSEKLGRHRWVVERTLASQNRYWRLTVRYEWRAKIHHALKDAGMSVWP